MDNDKENFSDNKICNLNKKYLHWTPQAIHCYERHCKCEGCLMNTLEHKCRMKETVLKIYAFKGCPPPPEPEPDIEEVYEYIEQGLDLKDIAPIFNMSVYKFREFTQAHGIDGRLIKGGEMAKRYKVRGKREG